MKNAALIGLGMVAETHLAALRDAQDLRLCGVMGRDSAKSKAFAEKAGKALGHPVKVYASAADIAKDGTVDFAIVATPPDTRLDLVQTLAAAGTPLLMEKPVERSCRAARDIVRLCSDHGIPLGVVFQHRARSASVALKDAVDQGHLGTVYGAEIRVPWWRDQSYYDAPGRGSYGRDGGGVMISQAIHTLDLALWVLGPFKAVQSAMHQTPTHHLEAEDWAASLFETHQGCQGTFTATTAAYPGHSESIVLYGTKASATLTAGTLTLHFRDGRHETHGAPVQTGGSADPMAFTHAWHQRVLEAFGKSLDGQGTPLASGQEALLSHAVIEAMEQSSRTGIRVEVEPQ